MGAEWLHADGRTERHDVANSRFRYLTNAPDKGKFSPARAMQSYKWSITIAPLILNLST